MEPVILNKADSLIEALPYIRRFHGKVIVIKCGGAAMTAGQDIGRILQDVALLHFFGMRPVVVHGGGNEISEMCGRLNLATQFLAGQRVTDLPTLEVVEMVLLGKTNKTIVSKLNQLGVKAVGLSGHDAAFLKVKKSESDPDLGYVGSVVSVEKTLIETLLNAHFIPVIAPIGVDEFGQSYNVNADVAAASIAAGLGAEKLIVVSDVNGVYLKSDDPSTQLRKVNKSVLQEFLEKKIIFGGMIPKLRSCIEAVERGVVSAHIVSGKGDHGLLIEVLTDEGAGTMITA